MASRIIVGLVILLAIVQGLLPDAIPGGLVPLALVILGLLYAIVAVDAEDATAYLVVALAVGAAAGSDVLSHIQGIGAQPGRHRRSDQYRFVCRCHSHTRDKGGKPHQGLKASKIVF